MPLRRLAAWAGLIVSLVTIGAGLGGFVIWYHETDLMAFEENAKEDSIELLAEKLTETYLKECDGAKRSLFTHTRTIKRLRRFQKLAEREYSPPPCWSPPEIIMPEDTDG